jgi:hypothetical protein
VIDSITLPESEWETLLPPRTETGTEWTLPDSVARKIARVLSPSSDQSTMPGPNEVTAVVLKGNILEVRDGVARLNYTGEIAAFHRYENKISSGTSRLTGIGWFDLKSKQLRSLTWIFDGIHRGAPPWDKPRQMGAVVQWESMPTAK